MPDPLEKRKLVFGSLRKQMAVKPATLKPLNYLKMLWEEEHLYLNLKKRNQAEGEARVGWNTSTRLGFLLDEWKRWKMEP